MTLESMKRRIEEVESGIEPDTVQVRLSTGEEREYSQAEVRQALNDALSGARARPSHRRAHGRGAVCAHVLEALVVAAARDHHPGENI